QLGGRPVGHKQARSGRTRNAHQHLAQFPGLWVRSVNVHNHLFEAKAIGSGSKPLHDGVEFVRFQAKRWPHIEENSIPVESLMRGSTRLVVPNGSYCFSEHPLQMRQLDN